MVSPALNFAHKLIALVASFVVVIGVAGLLSPTFRTFALQSAKGNAFATQQVAAVAMNPQPALTAVGITLRRALYDLAADLSSLRL